MTRSEISPHPETTSGVNLAHLVQDFYPSKQARSRIFFNLPALQIVILN